MVRAVRVRWSNLVLLAAIPACLAAPAPFLAGWHWTIDQLACFPVQAMAALLLASGLLLLAHRRRAAAALGAFAALAAAAVLPGFLRSPPAGDADGQPVRVLALNLLRGNEAEAPRALAAIASQAPDVLFCSEVTPAWLDALAAGLPELPHRCTRADRGYFGVALFSRWPLTAAEVLPLGFDWAPAVRAVVQTPGGPLGVLGLHAPRPGAGASCAERDHALAGVSAALAPLPTSRLVLGDANSTPWNHAFSAMLKATGLRQARDGSWAPTWNAMLPFFLRVPIDHVLVDPAIGVDHCAVGAPFGSDHLPLAATLRLPRVPRGR